MGISQNLEELTEVGHMLLTNGFDPDYMSIASDIFWPEVFGDKNPVSHINFKMNIDKDYIKFRNEEASIQLARVVHNRLSNFFGLEIDFESFIYLAIGQDHKGSNPDFSLLLRGDQEITRYSSEFAHYDPGLDKCYLPKSRIAETPSRTYFLFCSAAYSLASRYLYKKRVENEETAHLIHPPFLDHSCCLKVQKLMATFIFPQEKNQPSDEESYAVFEYMDNLLDADISRSLDDSLCSFWYDLITQHS